MNKRIIFIDIARTFAIVLALLDHSMNDFHVWENYSFQNFAIVKAITSSATPTFLFLFGMMIEIVYKKRLESKGLGALVPNLVKRSYQCYRGYTLTAIAGFIGGLMSFNSMVAAFLFLGKTHYGNILKLYAFYMFLSIPILFLRQKLGIKKLLAITLSLWIIYPLIQMIHIDNYHISILTSTLFGFGGKEGPSILYASSIVVFGMFSASFVSTEKKWLFVKANSIMLAFFGAAILAIVLYTGGASFIDQYFSNEYRYNSHPVYYICGIFLALVFTTLFALIFPIGSYSKKWMEPLLIFGQQSLDAFTWGNVFLNVFSSQISSYQWNELGPVCFIVLVFIFLHTKSYVENKKQFKIALFENINLRWERHILSPLSATVIRTIQSNYSKN